MNNIPPDIYEYVHELAIAIANATEAEDHALSDSLCQILRAYYEEQARLGRSHPFLTEAMADYTDAPSEAIHLYELSLEQALAFSGESTHTKMISLAGQLIQLGHKERAEAYLRDGRSEAFQHGDTFWIEEADRLLNELAM